MAGDMIFLRINIQEMVRVFRRLEHGELGLLMRIVLENCLMQGKQGFGFLEELCRNAKMEYWSCPFDRHIIQAQLFVSARLL
ncbi:MAG: hypothetical protein AB3N24_14290 [Leisingera sp.]